MANGKGRGQLVENVDARRLVVPLWAAVIVATAMVGSTMAIVAIYYSLSYDIRNLVTSVNALAINSVSRGDLQVFCLQAQLQNKGWVCPGAVGATVQVPPKSLTATQFQPRGSREVQ